MKVKQAKEYAELGILEGFQIVREGGGWSLVAVGRKGRQWPIKTVKGHLKIYASLDSIYSEIAQIAEYQPSLECFPTFGQTSCAIQNNVELKADTRPNVGTPED